jgi:hypothetical protein
MRLSAGFNLRQVPRNKLLAISARVAVAEIGASRVTGGVHCNLPAAGLRSCQSEASLVQHV